MQYFNGEYFNSKIDDGVYLIGCKFNENTYQPSWNAMEDRIEFGVPTGNSWLAVGTKKAIVIDSCAPVKGFREYVESLVDVEVEIVLSHGHFDHTYMLSEFDKVYMSKEDEPLLNGYLGFPVYENQPKQINYLKEGDILDLGDRELSVYSLKGHSDGSLLLLDKKKRILFAGDSIARRTLLFDIDEQKIFDYFNKIKKMRNEDFDIICTSHDRIPLKKDYIDYLFENITNIEKINEKRKLFNGMFGEFYTYKSGDERSANYINISILCKYRDSMIELIKKINNEGIYDK